MRKKILTLTAIALIGATSIATAGGHLPVEKREAAMKAMGGGAKTIGDMLKGTTDFDAAKANESLASMKAAMSTFGDYFPEGTELQGSNEFKAAPAIWSDPAGFDAEIAKMNAALDAAIAANPQDTAAMGAAFGAIGKSCSSCHEGYRVKQ